MIVGVEVDGDLSAAILPLVGGSLGETYESVARSLIALGLKQIQKIEKKDHSRRQRIK